MALLFALLLWVPLPFGSTPDEYQLPLVAGALLICALTLALVALEKSRTVITNAHRVWSLGAIAFLLVVVVQLIALPPSILGIVSPESARVWTRATKPSIRPADRASVIVASISTSAPSVLRLGDQWRRTFVSGARASMIGSSATASCRTSVRVLVPATVETASSGSALQTDAAPPPSPAGRS